MSDEDQFAILVSRAVLKNCGDDIELQVLQDLVQQAESKGGLDSVIQETRTSTRRPGDFGMEIIGGFVAVVLIEAARGLWKVYCEKVVEQLADNAAGMTLEQLRAIALRIWSGREEGVGAEDFERLLREHAKKNNLSDDELGKLIDSVLDASMKNEFESK